MDDAIDKCSDDDTCVLFHNDQCDDTGPFRLCKRGSILNNSSASHCAYVKEGKIMNEISIYHIYLNITKVT